MRVGGGGGGAHGDDDDGVRGGGGGAAVIDIARLGDDEAQRGLAVLSLLVAASLARTRPTFPRRVIRQH